MSEDSKAATRQRQDSDAIGEEKIEPQFDLNVALAALRSDSRRAAERLAKGMSLRWSVVICPRKVLMVMVC